MDALVKTRVAAGAAMLDTVYPGWAEVIDVDRLDIGDSSLCILGQLYSDPDKCCGWCNGTAELFDDDGYDVHGNGPGDYGFTGGADVASGDLEGLWVVEIHKRTGVMV